MPEHFIQTCTGKRFDLLDSDPESICIEDIAHSLSHQSRFTGHCKWFYSVALHSILVCEKAEPQDKLYALLHDAAEAYIGDISTPLKNILHDDTEEDYLWCLEISIMDRILGRFNIDVELETIERVKTIDSRMLITEAQLLLGDISGWEALEKYKPYDDFITITNIKNAVWHGYGTDYHQFINTFNILVKDKK